MKMAPASTESSAQGNQVIGVENVSKLFRTPSEGAISALQEIDLNISYGES
jgi:hypothetical protein